MALLEKEWYIEAPWGRICIVAWGNCYDTPVLACHGAMDSAVCFGPLLKLLPQKYYCIGIELPGSGKSDPLPPGMVLTIYDYVYAIHVVVKHFRWESFISMAHSYGAAIMKTYNLCYPGKISKIIEFDPLFTKIVTPGDFHRWYQKSFGEFFNNFEVYNVDVENTKKVLKEEAVQNLMKRRNLSERCAQETLERISTPAGDGYIRYTYDRRIKVLQTPPYTADHYKEVFTKMNTPLLSIIAQDTINNKHYELTPFLLDEKSYPNGNCKVKIVKGSHDVHYNDPGRVAAHVAEFLMDTEFKARL